MACLVMLTSRCLEHAVPMLMTLFQVLRRISKLSDIGSAHVQARARCSPPETCATFDNPNYERLISHYIGEKYTLRYTGGMVPDVFQVI